MTPCDLVVTGAAGFVGRHLVRRAQDAGVVLVAADWDLRDAALTERRLVELAPGAVAHLAASPRTSAPWEALRDDVAMAGSLLTAASRCADPPPVLMAGSAAQYGMGLPRLLTEDDPTEPVSSNGAVKCVLERAVTSGGLDQGVRVIWARAFNHIGPGQGEDAPASSWARQVAAAEVAGGGMLRTGALDVVRDFLDVRDVAAAYLALLRSGLSGVVNVCSGQATPLAAVADELVARARCPVERVRDVALLRASDPPYVVGDPTRLQRATGWAPSIDLGSSAAELLDDWRGRIASTGRPPAVSGASR